ncbi:MAG: glucose dehydrogenase, partial [Bacteroidetes bacterium]
MQSLIITGGNSGLGFEAAKNIATESKDFHLVLACRNPA